MISSIASYDYPIQTRSSSPNSYQTHNAAYHRRTRRPCGLRERFCSSQILRFAFIQGNGKRTSSLHNCKSFVKCHNPKRSSQNLTFVAATIDNRQTMKQESSPLKNLVVPAAVLPFLAPMAAFAAEGTGRVSPH